MYAPTQRLKGLGVMGVSNIRMSLNSCHLPRSNIYAQRSDKGLAVMSTDEETCLYVLADIVSKVYVLFFFIPVRAC